MIDIILPAEWYTEAAIRQWPHLEAFAVIAKCADRHQVKTAMLLGFCRLGRGQRCCQRTSGGRSNAG